ncbi:hypothetical protein N656DRAFT_556504 [Canariomyces notabilis]|uniref:Uncharacterized protein n=1 Tax=Canariomyces notabilis TaxID=2074819 RepID=A0AAN6TIB8_9PEZI|nr:hypothetical protein N656DRAFT_556504 [Canariomyces arenarius]
MVADPFPLNCLLPSVDSSYYTSPRLDLLLNATLRYSSSLHDRPDYSIGWQDWATIGSMLHGAAVTRSSLRHPRVLVCVCAQVQRGQCKALPRLGHVGVAPRCPEPGHWIYRYRAVSVGAFAALRIRIYPRGRVAQASPCQATNQTYLLSYNL